MSNRKDDGTETAWLGSGGHVIISGNMGMQSVVKITNQAQNAHDIKLTVLLQLL
jgi:RsiW-degrading membrane proteinase PrsW (M82 family)